MSIEETKKGLDIEWKVKIPSEKINLKLDKEYNEFALKLNLPGFRPGKVPISIVKQKYSQSVVQKILDEIINTNLRENVVKKNIKPSVQPKIEIDKYEEGGDLHFTAKFQIMPDVPEIDFKSIVIEKSELLIGKDDIDKTLKELADKHERFEPVKNMKSKLGDLILFDYEGKIDGKLFKGSQGKDETVVLGSQKYIPGYEEQMVGLDIDDQKEINLKFPDDYREKKIASKKATFIVKIKDIQQRVKKVDVDDKLAQEVGEKNLNELKIKVNQRMLNDFNNFSNLKMRRELTDKILDNCTFELPSRMIEDEKKFLESQNEKLEKKKETKEILKLSQRRVKLGIILNSIGKKNNIEVNDKDLTKAVVEEAQKYPGEEQKVVELYKKNPQMMENLRGIAFEEKVILFILNLCPKKVKKCSFDELFKSDKLQEEKQLVSEKKKEKKNE